MLEDKIKNLVQKRKSLKKEYFTIEEAKEYFSISSEISAYKMALELRKKDNKKRLCKKSKEISFVFFILVILNIFSKKY